MDCIGLITGQSGKMPKYGWELFPMVHVHNLSSESFLTFPVVYFMTQFMFRIIFEHWFWEGRIIPKTTPLKKWILVINVSQSAQIDFLYMCTRALCQQFNNCIASHHGELVGTVYRKKSIFSSICAPKQLHYVTII